MDDHISMLHAGGTHGGPDDGILHRRNHLQRPQARPADGRAAGAGSLDPAAHTARDYRPPGLSHAGTVWHGHRRGAAVRLRATGRRLHGARSAVRGADLGADQRGVCCRRRAKVIIYFRS